MYDYQKKGKPFENNQTLVIYIVLQNINTIIRYRYARFNNSFFSGYSDHTIGISACLYAVSKGAKILEKHFSNSKAMNIDTQQGHTGSMNMNDLFMIRELSDNLRLLIK